ncbi:hypothetical protein ACFXAZ_37290 [Streptomyces sp. NPDC059477]|uniref:SCO2583/SCO2584 N-terminal domain-containing protein n=1 Tax=Streptomyces sp. NPDC059477 TaxID=3346847 RepID=UPI0036B7C851
MAERGRDEREPEECGVPAESGEYGESEEYDFRWAAAAEHKEPSARARMLAARWKENPPGAVPFRPEPEGRRRRWRRKVRLGGRSPWGSVVIVAGGLVTVILLLGYVGFRAPF